MCVVDDITVPRNATCRRDVYAHLSLIESVNSLSLPHPCRPFPLFLSPCLPPSLPLPSLSFCSLHLLLSPKTLETDTGGFDVVVRWLLFKSIFMLCWICFVLLKIKEAGIKALNIFILLNIRRLYWMEPKITIFFSIDDRVVHTLESNSAFRALHFFWVLTSSPVAT